MFFNFNKSPDMESKLARGDGQIIGGASINLDVKKMEKFYTTYAPDLMDKMNERMDGMGGLFKYIGTGNIMSSIVNGEAGVLAIGKEMNGEYQIGSRTFISASEAGQKVFSLMRNEIKLDEGTQVNYVDGGLEALAPISGTSISMLKSNSKLKMPNGSEKFGKTGLFVFVDFNTIPRNDLGREESSFLDLLDYATLEMDNDGSKLFIKAKNDNKNILKIAMEETMKMLPMIIGGGMPF